MATGISEKLKVFIGDCNNRAGLRSRSQFARAMWCIDEADWPDGVQALKKIGKKSHPSLVGEMNCHTRCINF